MHYSCGKFGDCSLSHFGSIMQTNRHTDRQMQMNGLLLVDMSNELETHSFTLTEAVNMAQKISHSGGCWLWVALQTVSGAGQKWWKINYALHNSYKCCLSHFTTAASVLLLF